MDFVPLLFAGDINVYSVARAFHEEYGMVSAAYGKNVSWPCANSRIIDYTANPKADVREVFLELVSGFAERHRGKKVVLIGCGDGYVRLISENMPILPENVIAPYVDAALMDRLTDKEKFYAMCEEAGLPYPDTFVHRKEMGVNFTLPFDGPFILKPSNGVEYWENPFPGQKKAYKAGSREELNGIIGEVYDAGYSGSLIIQDFIPGDDSFMRVLTNYSGMDGKVRMMCLGHVLLEEHTPRGIGNHAVIITEREPGLEGMIKKFLEDMNYVGYSNLDIKLDMRDGRFKVLELNTRQGRSNYYVTAAGENVARLLIDDCVDGREQECRHVEKETLWMVVPRKVAFDYVPHEECRAKMRRLIREGNFINPLRYRHDSGIARRLRFFKSQAGHIYKYGKYLGKQRGGQDGG